MQIRGNPDKWQSGKGKEINVAGIGWLKSLAKQWLHALMNREKDISLDMSNIEYITLFEWATTLSIIDKIISYPDLSSFHIDLVGFIDAKMLPPEDYIAVLNHEPINKRISQKDFDLSDRVYSIVGFLESLGTLGFLDSNEYSGKVEYPSIAYSSLNLRAFYTREGEKPTVVLGLKKISNKEDCKEFLDQDNIRHWRDVMADRFRSSPLFESEEIWRVLCHELAVNIWEHSGASGCLSARVVLPFDRKDRPKWGWKNTYHQSIGSLWKYMKNGLLELCVADAGCGLVKTLQQAYLNRSGLNEGQLKAEDVLAFAFDELGTSKDGDESWITERHALGRILFIVAKYGGALTLRSDGIELIYESKGSGFTRRHGNLGYQPTKIHKLGAKLPGVQLQIILPLFPICENKAQQGRHSVFEVMLPKSFHTESMHVRGHLIPVLEVLNFSEAGIGRQDQLNFRHACENLSKELLERRPRSEPFILDFSGVNWTEGQFETFLYLLQNVIQNRLVLFVEISPKLAQNIIMLEDEGAPTQLEKELVYKKHDRNKPFYNDISEYTYLETYSRIHATVLGVDRDGIKYIFGLKDRSYEKPLLSLIDNPRSINDILTETYWGDIEESKIRSLLTTVNPLFTIDEKGNWKCNWGPIELANEVSRVMSLHFDDLLDRTEAWRGRDKKIKKFDEELIEDDADLKTILDSAKRKFKLPWQDEWREEFLEGSRILSRERYSDEAAQRLIYRLQYGLKKIGKSIKDIKVIVCITGPGMLLASALHRWWPSGEKPLVTDLGYYMMLGHHDNIPTIVPSGELIIVQDVIESLNVTGKLINLLREQNVSVLCLLSLIRLKHNVNKTRVTSFDEGWEITVNENDPNIPVHAMIEVPAPEKCEPPKNKTEDAHAFWIEPRSFHPIRFKTLRRDFEAGRDIDLDRRDKYLPLFDSKDYGCLFASGHYVYGRRHYSVAVDIRKTLEGPIGEMISRWIADLCIGKGNRPKELWETNKGYSLSGDVTAVLMPLHSQIHYLWPRISNLLAQRGRRQPIFLLDATLFTGRAPAYRIPAQLKYQLIATVNEFRQAGKKVDKTLERLRFLIIDDAIASGRTAETILGTITREVRKAFFLSNIRIEEMNNYGSPIEWIRYFAVLNQMGHYQHLMWRNLKYVGNPPINFVLEEFAPFMGVPVYDESDCPCCHDRLRLEHLWSKCEQIGSGSHAALE